MRRLNLRRRPAAWQDLPQEAIQQWIAAIPNHIKEIIRLEGVNEYKEGVKGFKRSWAGTRIKGKLSTLQSIDNSTQHQVPDVQIDADESSFRTGSEEESQCLILRIIYKLLWELGYLASTLLQRQN
jgi:hypothetical protein